MMGLLIIIIVLVLIGGGVWGWPLLAAALGIGIVTDKPSAVQHIRQLMTTHDITPEEVELAFNNPPPELAISEQRTKGDAAKTLFIYLGAIFIFAGIGTYIGMFWESMGTVMRITMTLGIGYLLLVVLISVLYEQKYLRAVFPITLTSVFMLVSGWFVFIHEVYPDVDDWRLATLFVFGTMAVHWAGLLAKYSRSLFAFFALFFVYGFMAIALDMLGVANTYIAIILGASLFAVGAALEKLPQRILSEPCLLFGAFLLNGGLFDLLANSISANWASLLIGLSLMLTAYGVRQADRYPRLVGLGYLFGSIMLYAGLFDLVEQTPIELVFLAVSAALLYMSVVLQSKVLLFTSVIAMLSFISYFSAEYFADFLGWPITLVLMGVAFMGVGMVALRVKRKI
jgi:hypothetical protein